MPRVMLKKTQTRDQREKVYRFVDFLNMQNFFFWNFTLEFFQNRPYGVHL